MLHSRGKTLPEPISQEPEREIQWVSIAEHVTPKALQTARLHADVLCAGPWETFIPLPPQKVTFLKEIMMWKEWLK